MAQLLLAVTVVGIVTVDHHWMTMVGIVIILFELVPLIDEGTPLARRSVMHIVDPMRN